MTFQEFLKSIDIKGINLRQVEKQHYGYTTLTYDRPNSPNEDSAVYKKWVCGGKERSAWEDELKDRKADPEPEFESLDAILEIVCPNVTYLQYKKIVAVQESTTEREHDWYTPEVEYEIRYITLRNLYNRLTELNLIDGEYDDDDH